MSVFVLELVYQALALPRHAVSGVARFVGALLSNTGKHALGAK